MLPWLNRTALVVRPKQPFFDWEMSLDPEFFADETPENYGSITYLLPECCCDEEVEEYVREYWNLIVEATLSCVWEDRADWPQMDYETFRQWFSCESDWIVLDLCSDPLEYQTHGGIDGHDPQVAQSNWEKAHPGRVSHPLPVPCPSGRHKSGRKGPWVPPSGTGFVM